jgi:hypothetical protein
MYRNVIIIIINIIIESILLLYKLNAYVFNKLHIRIENVLYWTWLELM